MPKVLEIVMKAVDKASSVFKGVGKAASDAADKASGGFSFKKANREYKTSETAAFLKTLRGAGALGGVTLVGNQFNAITDKVMELNAAFARGEETNASYFNKLAQSLPVLGSFVSGFNKIINARAQSQIDQTNRETEFSDTATGASKAMLTAYKGIREQIAKEEITLNVRAKLAGLRGLERDVVKAAADAQQQVAEARDKKAVRLKQFDETSGENIAKVRAQMSKATSEDEKSGYRDRISTLQKQQADERKNIVEASDREINETAAAAAAEANQVQADAMRESFRITQAYYAAVWDTQAQTIQIRLRTDRDFLAAELAQLRQSTIDKKRELDQQYQDAIKKALPGDRAAIYSAFIAQRNALDDQEQANATADVRNTLDEANLTVLQMAAQAGDAQAKAQLEQVQALREETDLRKQLTTIIKDAASDPAAKAQAQREIKQLDQVDKQRATHSLDEQYQNALEAQSKYATSASDRAQASRELEKRKIIQEAKDKKAELDKILNDSGTSAAQKAQAKANFDQWKNLQGQRYMQEEYGNRSHSNPLPNLEESHFLTGLKQRAEAGADHGEQLVKLMEEGNKINTDIATAIGNLASDSKDAPKVQIGATGAYGG